MVHGENFLPILSIQIIPNHRTYAKKKMPFIFRPFFKLLPYLHENFLNDFFLKLTSIYANLFKTTCSLFYVTVPMRKSLNFIRFLFIKVPYLYENSTVLIKQSTVPMRKFYRTCKTVYRTHATVYRTYAKISPYLHKRYISIILSTYGFFNDFFQRKYVCKFYLILKILTTYIPIFNRTYAKESYL